MHAMNLSIEKQLRGLDMKTVVNEKMYNNKTTRFYFFVFKSAKYKTTGIKYPGDCRKCPYVSPINIYVSWINDAEHE